MSSEGGLKNYISKMEKDGEWGDAVVLAVASVMHSRRIEVVDLDNPACNILQFGLSNSVDSAIRLGYKSATKPLRQYL